MPSDPRATFREQAEGVFLSGAGFLAYFLYSIATTLEVRTEGDRVLVVVCTVGAAVALLAFVVLLIRSTLQIGRVHRERRDATREQGRAGDPADGS